MFSVACPELQIWLAIATEKDYLEFKLFIGQIKMFDFPELLIIGLSVVLAFLSINHWISTIALDRSGTDRKE